MNRDTDLVHMANRIAQAFAVYPEAEATEGIARHIREFWEPKMRERIQFLALGDAPLDPAVKRALALLPSV